jgi:hypothetical protein
MENTMSRYLVFVNADKSGKDLKSDTPEYVACEIASVLGHDGFSVSDFTACLENTPEATMATLKSLPKFSLALDEERIEKWTDFLMPMHERITNVIDAIGEAYSILFDSVNDLADHCEEDDNFSEINRIGRKDFEYAFEYLQEPDETEFADRIEEIYEINRFQHSKA